jgi:hypothetical protein
VIGKIVAGSGAGGVTAYVTQKDGAQILLSTWAGPPDLWASQIDEHTEAMGSAVVQTVVHVSLAAAPDEHLSDDQWRAVAEAYLERMGWDGHDHAVVRHTDTGHDHIHLILARVGHDGQVADLHDDYPRQERALDSLERDFHLERTHEQLRIQAEKDPFRAIESVTRSHLTFERADIERYFERMGFDQDKTRELTDRAMSDDRVLYASTSGVADKFTTVEVKAEVQRLDSALRQLASQEARPALDRGEGAREGLDAGQRMAADRIAGGGGLVVIEGFAGAGKSTMLRQANEDLRFSGYDVIGVAPSGKAAAGLQQSAGIESNTLTKTLMQVENGERQLTANSVVILDEAGMARNDELGKLAQRVADAGGRLVLVHDARQLGAVGRGGGSSEAQRIAGGETVKLDEIHRQREQWQKEASKDFGEGRAREALQSYVEHNKVEWAASRGTARDMLVNDYMRELDRGAKPEKMLALGHENRDVKAMNAEIRDALKERGGLQDERTYRLEDANGKAQKINVAVGDRVVFEKNNARTGEKNGEFGTVTKTDRKGFDVRMDDGRRQRVEDGGKHQMSHGYASTIHKSQGSTVDKTFVLASRGMDSKLTYVSMSRQREDVKLYANNTEFKDAGHLKNSLGRDGGREAFDSVRSAGKAAGSKQEWDAERAMREADARQAARGGIGGGEKEKGSWVDATLAAAALDQGIYSSGLLDKEKDKEKSQESRGQEKDDGRGSAGVGKDQQSERRAGQQEKSRTNKQDHAPAESKGREHEQRQPERQAAGEQRGQEKESTAARANAGEKRSAGADRQSQPERRGQERGGARQGQDREQTRGGARQDRGREQRSEASGKTGGKSEGKSKGGYGL